MSRPTSTPAPNTWRAKPATPCGTRRRARQRGAVLLFGMIALVVLLVGTAALVRSMNTSVFTAGNYGFKRDLTNQGERAVAAVLDVVQTGALSTVAAREASDPARNYSAQLLATNPQGIPLALLSDAQFAGVGVAANDISISDMGITIRYVVDRVSADRVFRDAMADTGTGVVRRWIVWTAVTVASRPCARWNATSRPTSTSATPSPYVSRKGASPTHSRRRRMRPPVCVSAPVYTRCTSQSSASPPCMRVVPSARLMEKLRPT